MLLKLRTLSNEEKLKASKKMYDCLSGHPAFRHARTVMMYMALSSEISLDLCFHLAWAAGKTVALPRVEGNDLKPCRVLNLEKDLVVGAYNVLEPREGCDFLAPENLDLVIVPGVAFDRLGWRLGRGKGFYDRFLNMLPETCHTAGVCYKAQLLKSIPSGPNDICMKEVLAV